MQFDFIAKYYSPISRLVFWLTLERAKISFFEQIPVTAKVLFIGGGDGTSLKKLIELKPLVQIDYVEASERMIFLAQKKVGPDRSVKFIQSSIENFTGEGYDVVITEFLFDLFELKKIKELIPMISFKLKDGGFWIDTDFRKTPQLTHRFVLKLMYLFFRVTAKVKTGELIDPRPIMAINGFILSGENKYKSGFVTSSIFQQQ